MNSKTLLSHIKNLYENKNINIIDYLKSIDKRTDNTLEDIMISYDFQAGTYVEQYRKDPEYRNRYLERLTKTIDELDCKKKSIFECGVGEGTVLIPLLNKLNHRFAFMGGGDISWSRTKTAQLFADEFLKVKECNVDLVMADMFRLPLKDNAIDIVFTRQAIEPNGGHEKEILQELYRITNEYLILIEPAYDLANKEAKAYMESRGYVRKLYETAKQLGYKILSWDLYGISENPLNPVGMMIIEKRAGTDTEQPWACPVTGAEMLKLDDVFFSSESLLAYPVIQGVPCLLENYAVIATKMTR